MVASCWVQVFLNIYKLDRDIFYRYLNQKCKIEKISHKTKNTQKQTKKTLTIIIIKKKIPGAKIDSLAAADLLAGSLPHVRFDLRGRENVNEFDLWVGAVLLIMRHNIHVCI